MRCTGKGTPVVLLDSPIGETSDIWTMVEPLLNKHTKVRRECEQRERKKLGLTNIVSDLQLYHIKSDLIVILPCDVRCTSLFQVCVYDRAGLGFSHRGYRVRNERYCVYMYIRVCCRIQLSMLKIMVKKQRDVTH